MLSYVVFILVGGLLVFAFAWMLQPAVDWQNQAACRPLTPEARSGQAPDIEFETMDGQKGKLSDFRGKFVVLNFWATWCEPCVREWPELEKLAQRFKEEGDVGVRAVSLDQEADAIGPFLDRMHLSDTLVTVVRDPTGEVNQLFGSEKIPDTFFVDEAGELRAAFINVRDWGRPSAFHCVGSMAGRR